MFKLDETRIAVVGLDMLAFHWQWRPLNLVIAFDTNESINEIKEALIERVK